MSTDCPCTNISNSFTITKDGVLQSVLECEDCGKREVEVSNNNHKKRGKYNLFTINDIGGDIIKDDETYFLKDNKLLNNLIVSSTLLHPFKQTNGHNHSGQEEVYIFVHGFGEMEIDNEKFYVKPNDVVLIPDGAFHRVKNTQSKPLYFVCVFDGKRSH